MRTNQVSTQSATQTETDRLLALGAAQGWDLKIIGYSDMPAEPIKSGDWLITPAHLDSSPIPVRAMQRLQTMYSNGVHPLGLVIVHEAPNLLPPGIANDKSESRIAIEPKSEPQPQFSDSKSFASKSAPGFFSLVGTALKILLSALFVVGAMGILALDPILIAVMDDGAWVELDRWDV